MLGDQVERALVSLGITQQRVEAWVGKCNCEGRRDRINAIELWARRVLSGKIERATEYLNRIMGDES